MISTGLTVSLVVFLGAMTVLLVRSRDVRAWEAVIICLFGVYLGHTPVADTIDGFVVWVLSSFSHF